MLPDGDSNVVANGGLPIKKLRVELHGPFPRALYALTFQLESPFASIAVGVIEQVVSLFAQLTADAVYHWLITVPVGSLTTSLY